MAGLGSLTTGRPAILALRTPMRYTFARLLRLDHDRCKEGDRKNDREPDPPHWHLTGMAGGSLADQNYATIDDQSCRGRRR